MARRDDFTKPIILLVMYNDNFQEVDYMTPLNGPFDITNPIQALQLRAESKGMGVIVQAACVPLEQIYGVPEDDESKAGSSEPGE